MPSCLGIYTDNNMVKYAKLTTDKIPGKYNIDAFGVKFYDNIQTTVNEITQEVGMGRGPIAVALSSEDYYNTKVFSNLKRKDIADLVTSEYKEVNRLEELVIAIDTSGSCSGETVQRFLGETYGILSEKENFFSRMKVYIVQCDCFIQKVDVIHSEEEWKEYIRNVKIQGRGGTDFRPVFELIRQEKERKELKNLRALIYFTDGDGIYPGQKPDYETAFVFLKRTDKMKLVPPWAKCLITGMGQTAEQMSV